MVIFGASGDLCHRKIFPALYALAYRRLLPERFAVVGTARSDWTDDEFRGRMESAVREFGRDDFKQEVWDWLAAATHYLPMDFAEEERRGPARGDPERPRRGARHPRQPRLLPRRSAGRDADIVQQLGKRRKPGGWVRLIIEKPFGRDITSAQELTELIGADFTEQEVFRIDHYLGKETVQNMLALRFANGIFEPIWNRQFIDHVQITVGESLGIEGRAGFYERRERSATSSRTTCSSSSR